MATTPSLGGSFAGKVIVDPVKVAAFIRNRNGPVLRRLIADGQAVKAEARRRVGVYRPPDAFSAANRGRAPGTLRDSIVTRVVAPPGPLAVAVQVGSENPIALLHHEGTVAHVIRPRTKPRLVFFWPKVGRVVAFPKVNHPGTLPNRYLTDSLAVLPGRYRGR